MAIECLYLPPDEIPPDITGEPFRAVLVIDEVTNADWRNLVSHWLVGSRCLYLMAWGVDCETWHDAVDWALLETHDYQNVADDDHIMTTWHDREPLAETLWFAKFVAFHPTVALPRLLLISIGKAGRCGELVELYASVPDD